ncbi:MAG TPA: TIGR03435 family protein [Acidobacteriaceae bacterium]|jgi:uncharacterized protein (TIGR03435 family)
MFLKTLAAVLLALSAIPYCVAQAHPTFDVASVRPAAASVDPNEGYWSPPTTNSFKAHNLTLARLITLAWNIDDNQIADKPAWLETDHFEVTAKPAGDIILTREELRPRLQALLQERFHLVVHTETRPVPGYALTIAKGGAKLQATKGSRFPNYRVGVTDTELNGLNWSMAFLATQLQHPTGRPVIDKTGLTGSYDLKVNFSGDPSNENSLPSIFTALQETLGLKLIPAKVPVEFLVIDHADRVPTEN